MLRPTRAELQKAALAVMLVMTLPLFLGGCTLLMELAPSSEDTSHIRDWLIVPVFYATTRERATGKDIEFLEKRGTAGLKFGVKRMVVPAPDPTPLSDETVKRMGWKRIHLDVPLANGKIPAIPADAPTPDMEYSNSEVVANFDKYRAATGSKEVVFFVHGCCAPFDASLQRSANIAAHMQLPLVVYDWVSPKGFTKYLENETCVEQTYDDFYDFMNAVASVVPAHDTTIIGHSMGSRFLDVTLLRRAERKVCGVPVAKYKEVIFSQPDSDASAYIRHNAQVTSQAEKTRIYFNSKDGRLDASAEAHGGFPRLGRPGPLLEKLCSLDNQDMIDITQCATGHEIPFWVLADLSHDRSTKHAGFECKQISPHYFMLKKL